MNVLVVGGTGFVGKALVDLLFRRGDTCQVFFHGDKVVQPGTLPLPQALFAPAVIAGADAVINLAGENIAGSRWTEAVRRRILTSRVDTTRQIVRSIRRNRELGFAYPSVLINASAAGYYGTDPSRWFDEDSSSGHDFLAEVCRQWEAEAMQAEALGLRVVRFRFGHILERDGGLLSRVAIPFRYGLGGYLGHGRQWISWIHRKELIHIILLALEQDRWHGAYNLCTPNAVTMKDFMKVLGNALGSKSRTFLPSFVVRLLFGEMADIILLKGQRVYPKRLLQQGYVFQYPFLAETLADIYHPDR